MGSGQFLIYRFFNSVRKVKNGEIRREYKIIKEIVATTLIKKKEIVENWSNAQLYRIFH